jgi:hypothetical protein
MKQYDECREEITKQLDIELLLHKLGFLESAIEYLFDENQLYGMHLQKLDTLEKVKKRRKQYDYKQKMSNES